jgi:hypothetical protein
MTKISDIVKKKKENKSNFLFGKIAGLCEEYWDKALGKEYNVIIKNSDDIKQEVDFSSLKFPKSFSIENAKEIAEYIIIPKQEEFPSEIKISNLAELSKYFEIKQKIEIPKSFDIKNLKDIPSIKFPENLKKLSFKKTEEILSKLVKEFALARKAKRDEVFIKNKDPKEYIPVRIVDKRGTDFIESFGSAILALPDEVGQLNASKIRINPATEDKQDILSAYKITDIDDTGYYGYLKADGSWYIMQENSGAYRYIKGDSDYSTAWTGRAGLSYDYFNQVF